METLVAYPARRGQVRVDNAESHRLQHRYTTDGSRNSTAGTLRLGADGPSLLTVVRIGIEYQQGRLGHFRLWSALPFVFVLLS
jgi:hypothetical protein